jgi:hypothetical protein
MKKAQEHPIPELFKVKNNAEDGT